MGDVETGERAKVVAALRQAADTLESGPDWGLDAEMRLYRPIPPSAEEIKQAALGLLPLDVRDQDVKLFLHLERGQT